MGHNLTNVNSSLEVAIFDFQQTKWFQKIFNHLLSQILVKVCPMTDVIFYF